MICRLTLAAVFFMAAATKLTDLAGFENRLTLHSGLPLALARVVGAFLPWLELTTAFALLLGNARREAATIQAGLLVLFIGYIIWKPTETDCGCFLFPQTMTAAPSRTWLIVRNVLFLACAWRVARQPTRRASTARIRDALDNEPRHPLASDERRFQGPVES